MSTWNARAPTMPRTSAHRVKSMTVPDSTPRATRRRLVRNAAMRMPTRMHTAYAWMTKVSGRSMPKPWSHAVTSNRVSDGSGLGMLIGSNNGWRSLSQGVGGRGGTAGRGLL
ncbi:hypothetical protein BC477_13175 [Clavibacter michiganensis subsp. michiganensis]|uniref:Uncharacterized protein n=1 Tax=Clavibacter michiganensis subsp. michiganensis TaxID=33013 RepID=A0A251XHV3_CLAMM|nr:hypothetical protein BC477_13175 [Clavibacter michiganensis subsp. michiganensis]OUE02748.1 hypothetical protein CMMCAS07_12080 [Clavibacter michiganensis subsp. michiganensis]